MTLAKLLLNWYDANRRDLPWRKDKNPYHIWVSEVMLQQTRVEAVRPYYERWLERFPTMRDLAEASEEEVLQYWQGLGYYSRARALQQGVREVISAYGGEIPADPEAIRTLSGIGDYTAGAILSIAYNQHEPAVDGNVLRVFSRLFCVSYDITQLYTKRLITTLALQELPVERPGDFNQAVMDLGAAICTPRKPRCGACPLSNCCAAFQEGRQLELPVRKKAAQPELVELAAAVMEQNGQYLLRKRPSRGILANMWEFPALEVVDSQGEPQQLTEFLQQLGQTGLVDKEPVIRLLHTFSHRKWQVTFYRVTAVAISSPPKESRAAWIASSEWSKLSFAGPHRKVAALLE